MKIIDGFLDYDQDYFNFKFIKKINDKERKIKILNTASGIKSFGILQLLEKTCFFDKRSLLIVDEPEVHLHPKWQVEYAKILVNLVKEGKTSVLVFSQSPFIVSAFKQIC